MNVPQLEIFLAKLYVDKEARARFLILPYDEAKLAGLSEEECMAMDKIDRIGLRMAAKSFAHKRQHRRKIRLWRYLCFWKK